ncbi:MAG TPA: ECF-type sigma factor [Gemmataceae bacterium]|nr:ECF-type sigma factor [Gemmataceae bacterium]
MSGPGSITGWLDGVRAHEGVAAQRLWEGYFRRLVGLARDKLNGRAVGPDDAEDIALSAFKTFCLGAEQGRFPQLNDRHDLWQVLVMLTERKAIDSARRQRAAKRGGREQGRVEMGDVVAPGPTPSFAAGVADEFCRLLDALPDELRTVALLKLEGYTNSEIAGRLRRSVATVERKLRLIRRTWERPDAHG